MSFLQISLDAAQANWALRVIYIILFPLSVDRYVGDFSPDIINYQYSIVDDVPLLKMLSL